MRNTKIHIRAVLFYYLLMIITGVYFVTTLSSNNNPSILVYLLFIAIGLIALINLSFEYSKLGYSINSMHWLFVFIFLFLAPITQYSSNKFPWRLSITQDELIRTNVIILLWCLIYMVSRYFFMNRKRKKRSNKEVASVRCSRVFIRILFIFSSILFLYGVNRIGLLNLFSRYTYTRTLSDGESSIYFLFFNTFVRSSVLFSFATILLYYKSNKNFINLVLTMVSGIYVLLLYFPTGSGRFWAYMIYIGILIHVRGRFHNKYFLKIITIFGLLYLMPLFNAFRYSAIGDANFTFVLNSDITSILTSGDFDAYSMILRTARYLDSESISFGYQLLGNLLFFIPRSIWPSKPIGSGAFIGKFQGLDFLNISSPLPAEGLLNFGYIGVALYALIFAYIVEKFDYLSVNHNAMFENSYKISMLPLLYPFLIGFTFLLLRGDFLTSFSNLIGFALPAFLISKLANISLKK